MVACQLGRVYWSVSSCDAVWWLSLLPLLSVAVGVVVVAVAVGLPKSVGVVEKKIVS